MVRLGRAVTSSAIFFTSARKRFNSSPIVPLAGGSRPLEVRHLQPRAIDRASHVSTVSAVRTARVRRALPRSGVDRRRIVDIDDEKLMAFARFAESSVKLVRVTPVETSALSHSLVSSRRRARQGGQPRRRLDDAGDVIGPLDASGRARRDCSAGARQHQGNLTVHHPRILRSAALARIDDERTFIIVTARQAAGRQAHAVGAGQQ